MVLDFSSPNGPKNQCANLRKDLTFFIVIPPPSGEAALEATNDDTSDALEDRDV